MPENREADTLDAHDVIALFNDLNSKILEIRHELNKKSGWETIQSVASCEARLERLEGAYGEIKAAVNRALTDTHHLGYRVGTLEFRAARPVKRLLSRLLFWRRK